MSRQQSETITVFSDYVCPFCYLGRHSLERYQEERDERLAIDWHPFDLRAGQRGPDGEIDHSVDGAATAASPERAGRHADDGKDEEYFEQARENVRRLQEKYDVEMTLEIAEEIDSFDAQVASLYVKEEHPERWLDFDWAIFEALWTEGRDVGDPDVLADLAADAGVAPEEIREAVADEDLRERLRGQFEAAQQQGVTGVPTFAYEGYAARGAVPPEHLRRLVEGT